MLKFCEQSTKRTLFCTVDSRQTERRCTATAIVSPTDRANSVDEKCADTSTEGTVRQLTLVVQRCNENGASRNQSMLTIGPTNIAQIFSVLIVGHFVLLLGFSVIIALTILCVSTLAQCKRRHIQIYINSANNFFRRARHNTNDHSPVVVDKQFQPLFDTIRRCTHHEQPATEKPL